MDLINFFYENPNFFVTLVALVALIMGSFINVVIYRLPRIIEDEWSLECRDYLGLKPGFTEKKPLSLSLPFSHCPSCKKTLKPWHNIPVISYLVLRGKCAYCHARINLRYPFVELLCCVASVYVAWRFGFTWQTLGGLLFTWILIALTFIDLDYHLLPDQLTYSLFGLGLFLSLFLFFTTPEAAIIGGISGYLFFAITQWLFKLVTGKVGMGEGDYKLLAALGAFLGWQLLPVIILFASLSGVILAVSFMVIKHSYKSVPIPFGPYLAVAGWISLMWGNEILALYLHAIH